MNKKGGVLLMALMLVSIFSIILGALGYMWHSRWKAHQLDMDGLQAFQIAEAGLEYGRVLVLNSQGEKFYNIPRSINQTYAVNETNAVINGTFKVTITDTALVGDPVKQWDIDSIGRYKSATREVFVSIYQTLTGNFSTKPCSWQEK